MMLWMIFWYLSFGKSYADFGETLYDSLLSKEDNLKICFRTDFE